MSEYGDAVATRITGPLGDTVRVDQADPTILVAAELIDDWMKGEAMLTVRLEEGGMFSFGTPGEGLGRVMYQLGERYDSHTYVARRIDHDDRT